MSKILFVGDVHTKQFIIDRVDKILDTDNEIEKAIFVGDYVDEWTGTVANNIDILTKVFQLKEKYGSRVELLVGNHELSYLGFPCSGYKESPIVTNMLLANLSKFKVIEKTEDYLVSHGGITEIWYQSVSSALGIDTMDTFIDRVNSGFINHDISIYQALSKASQTSGGLGIVASCLWARPADHEVFPLLVYTQIVGHTPIKNGILDEAYHSPARNIYYIDTFSTYQNGSPVGKQEILAFDNEKKEYYIY